MTLAGDISPVFLASATGSLVFVLAVVAVVVINFGIMKKRAPSRHFRRGGVRSDGQQARLKSEVWNVRR